MTDEILKERTLEQFIGSWHMVPSTGGVFEVRVNGDLIYSKKATGRHAQPGEIKALLRARVDALRAARGMPHHAHGTDSHHTQH